MKNRTFVFLLLLCYALSIKAAPVDSLTARRVAETFRATIDEHSAEGVLVESELLGFKHLYLFNFGENDGFVIVAGDDRAMPILGYSTVGHFDETLPEVVTYWLHGYEESIAVAIAQGVVADEETQKQWQMLLNGTYAIKATKAVTPLLMSSWDQTDYYNSLCPINDVSGKRMPAGCVAVAMAQIMNYWAFPKTGIGEHSYICANVGRLSANFQQTTYSWTRMPNILTSSSASSQVQAVATLILHCGIAVDMEYSMDGSGAYANSYDNGSLPCAEHALSRYFDYKSTIHSIYQEDYNANAWKNAIKSELQAGRPVIYGGRGADVGGHAFVCDGFRGELFHINWGWGGDYNGYYRLTALSPGLSDGITPVCTFNEEHSLVIGIEPNTHLRVDTTMITFDAEGGEYDIVITTETGNSDSWTIDTPEGWLQLSGMRGMGGGRRSIVTITAEANTTGMARKDTLWISQGERRVSVIVTQLACQKEEMCQLSVQMNDKCADSWNFAYLDFCDTLGGSYGKAFLISGEEEGSMTIGVCPQPVRLVWHQGVWDEECGFSVSCGQGNVLYTHSMGQKINRSDLEQISHPCRCEMTYLISVRSNNQGYGSVAGGGEFHRGEVTTISAESKRGHHFAHWNDGDTTNPRNVIVNGDITYTAYFEANIYNISVQPENEAYGRVSGGGRYAFGDTATVRAMAATGFRFLQWDNGEKDSIYRFIVDTDIVLTAMFAAEEPASLAYPETASVSYAFSEGRLLVQGVTGHWILVCDMLGRRIYHGYAVSNNLAIPLKQRGVYIINIDGCYIGRQVCY